MNVSARGIVDTVSLMIVCVAVLFAARVFLAQGEDERIPTYGDIRTIPPEVFVAASTGHRLGPENAPVVVTVFCDYGCSFCREFDQSLRAIRDRYPEHVAVVLKHFVPITNDPFLEVALGAECAAEQGAFSQFHSAALQDHALASAENWRTIADAAFSPDVDRTRFDTCVQTAALASNLATDYEQGKALGVDSTPTYFVNGEKFEGASSFARLDSLVASHFPRRASR